MDNLLLKNIADSLDIISAIMLLRESTEVMEARYKNGVISKGDYIVFLEKQCELITEFGEQVRLS